MHILAQPSFVSSCLRIPPVPFKIQSLWTLVFAYSHCCIENITALIETKICMLEYVGDRYNSRLLLNTPLVQYSI